MNAVKTLFGLAVITTCSTGFLAGCYSPASQNAATKGAKANRTDDSYIYVEDDITKVILVNETTETIPLSFREKGNCNNDDYVEDYDLYENNSVTLIPETDSNGFINLTKEGGTNEFNCISANGDSNSDDFEVNENGYGLFTYDAGSANSGGVDGYSGLAIIDYDNNWVDLCYIFDEDGVDGNEKVYIWPQYDGETTIYINFTEYYPTIELPEC